MKIKKRWHLISALHPIVEKSLCPSLLPEYEVKEEPRIVDGVTVNVPVLHVVIPPVDKTCVDDLTIENLTRLGTPLLPSSSTLVPDRLQSSAMLDSAGSVIDDNVVVPLNPVSHDTSNETLE